jgi:hypothetical protein
MSPNPNSILDSIKKTIGIDSADTTFDLDVTLFINSVLGTLQQLGVGPSSGFSITDNTALWTDYIIRDDILGLVKQFVSLSVRLGFDMPDSRFGVPAYQKMLDELAWRINIMAESTFSSGWWLLDGLSDFPSGASLGDWGFDSPSHNVYVNGSETQAGLWWNLTGLSDFPVGAIVGDFGYDSATGNVWRKTA